MIQCSSLQYQQGFSIPEPQCNILEHWSSGGLEQGVGDNAVHCSIALLIRSFASQKYRALEQWREWKVEK